MSTFRHPISFIDIRYEDRLQIVIETVEIKEAKGLEGSSLEVKQFLDNNFRIYMEIELQKRFCGHHTNLPLVELGLTHDVQVMERGELLYTYRCEK